MAQAFMIGLGWVARYGRFGLVAGLIAGIALPSVAQTVALWLPQLVMGLLFLVALRTGPDRAREGLANLPATVGIVLLLQLGLPLGVVVIAQLCGIAHATYVLAAVLVLAAPALSGSPNLASILGVDPEPAFRLLIVGTVLLPLTVVPLFWMLPQFGDLQTAVAQALRALWVICVAMGGGFAWRAYALPNPTSHHIRALDGAMTLAMIVMVTGLMVGLRPALSVSVGGVMGWMALAFGLNIGMQMLSYLVLCNITPRPERIAISIVSGNRNVAIFLVALSPAAAEPLLIFLACYQVPMYLTPVLMARLYR